MYFVWVGDKIVYIAWSPHADKYFLPMNIKLIK